MRADCIGTNKFSAPGDSKCAVFAFYFCIPSLVQSFLLGVFRVCWAQRRVQFSYLRLHLFTNAHPAFVHTQRATVTAKRNGIGRGSMCRSYGLLVFSVRLPVHRNTDSLLSAVSILAALLPGHTRNAVSRMYNGMMCVATLICSSTALGI